MPKNDPDLTYSGTNVTEAVSYPGVRHGVGSGGRGGKVKELMGKYLPGCCYTGTVQSCASLRIFILIILIVTIC